MSEPWLVGALALFLLAVIVWKWPAQPTYLVGEAGPEIVALPQPAVVLNRLRLSFRKYACSCGIAARWWRPTANPMHGGPYCQNTGRVFGEMQPFADPQPAPPSVQGPVLRYDDGQVYKVVPVGSGAFMPTSIIGRDRPEESPNG